MDGGIRDWLTGLSRREMVALAVIGLAVAAGAGLWYVRSLPRPVSVVAAGDGTSEGPSGAAPAPTPSPAAIHVHVAGAVGVPGVYEFREGDRVVDAIERAGGPRRGAQLAALNLAALLVDAQQVYVPRKGESSPPGGSGSGGGGPPGEAKINVNAASPQELEELPGIGPVLAERIYDHREKNGPFTRPEDLLEVSGIGEKRLEAIVDLIAL
ncbi:MAG: helix-hairpin-helix domain-containing protein [Actinomycetota bacterium]|nr:helix-hairpin-helix domain-containing protein [Actinomycetota bacterium]